MSTVAIEQLLKLRIAKADRAQLAYMKSKYEYEMAREFALSADKILIEYVEERPAVEGRMFEGFVKSDCAQGDVDDYRHSMSKISTGQIQLENACDEALGKQQESERAVESALVALNEINKKVEKLTILEESLAASENIEAQRVEDNELDEQASLAGSR